MPSSSSSAPAPWRPPRRRRAHRRPGRPPRPRPRCSGPWHAAPALAAINRVAMNQVRDPVTARARAMGQRGTYAFAPGGNVQIVILARRGPEDDPMIAHLEPRSVDATWDVVGSPKGL